MTRRIKILDFVKKSNLQLHLNITHRRKSREPSAMHETIVDVDFYNDEHIEHIKRLSMTNNFHTEDIVTLVCGDEEHLLNVTNEKLCARRERSLLPDAQIRNALVRYQTQFCHRNQDNHKCLLMYSRGTPLGFLSYSVHDDDEQIEILFILVDGPSRRLGYGSRMLEFLKSLNNKQHIITVRSDDDISTEWYVKNGFYNMSVEDEFCRFLEMLRCLNYKNKARSTLAFMLSDHQKKTRRTRLNFLPTHTVA